MAYIQIHGRRANRSWQQHIREYKHCEACSLHKSRYKIVLYRGSIPADILFISEAPGDVENLKGFPLTGPTQEFLQPYLDTLKEAGIRWGITNVVGCQPPNGRDPSKEEAMACRPRLDDIVERISPRSIILLGGVASKYGKHYDAPTYEAKHPAYLIRLKFKRSQFEYDLECNRFAQVINQAVGNCHA